MTDKEHEFLSLGFPYAEGMENFASVEIPGTGRLIYRKKQFVEGLDFVYTWSVQLCNDNYWVECDDLLNAVKLATPPKPSVEKECLAEIVQFVDNYEEFTGENTENYAWRQGVVHGEQLLADSIKNIIKGHNLDKPRGV